MRTIITCILLLTALSTGYNQSTLYFPPITGNTWASTSPTELGWCQPRIDSLYRFLDDQNTKAFIVLKDGKIVLEKYFDTFTQDSLWYWASAGKTVTGFLVGLAQEDGLLKIDESSSKYLGNGWTSLPADKEKAITIRHQLTMTSGLDDKVVNSDCTDPACLQYKADAGNRWAYHNAPYTILDQVVEKASGKVFNQYFLSRLRNPVGMNGAFVKLGYLNVYFSNARSMARFGLLLLNNGKWSNTVVMKDTAYLRQMLNTSQTLNPSYGYLTWLNGKSGFMVPGLQAVFPGFLQADAPVDMYSALGKNGQIINVVPGQNLVMIRMGDAPDSVPVPFLLNNQIWQYFNLVTKGCTVSDTRNLKPDTKIHLYPNPTMDRLYWNSTGLAVPLRIVDSAGKTVAIKPAVQDGSLAVNGLSKGIYWVSFWINGQIITQRFVKS